MAGQRRWIAVGALLGFLAVGSNVALMAVSAYLISKAAIVSNVAEIALVITAVRVLAIGRAAFRYLERYVTHRATFAILAELRVWFFASIEPLAPARLATRRSGDLLARIVADIETLEDFYVRVVIPPVVAGLVTAFAGLVLGLLDVTLGLTLVTFLLVSGIALPMLARRLSRAPAATFIATRGEFGATLVDEINGLADLVALDRAAAHRERTLVLGAELDAATRPAGHRPVRIVGARPPCWRAWRGSRSWRSGSCSSVRGGWTACTWRRCRWSRSRASRSSGRSPRHSGCGTRTRRPPSGCSS